MGMHDDVFRTLPTRIQLGLLMEATRRVKSTSVVKTLWLPDPRNRPQTDAYHCLADELFMGGAAGGGKALGLETHLPTPVGATTMFKIDIGDPLFDENGRVCRVTEKSEILIDREVYRLQFEDGSVFFADADHQWLTFTAAELDREGFHGALRTTATLADMGDDVVYVPPVRFYPFPRKIVSIDKVQSVPVQCLSVDSPSRLFCIGKRFVPTHNSDLLLGLALAGPHRRSIIFRRLGTTLKMLIERSHEILRDVGAARFNENIKLWRDLPDGRILEFGAMKLEKDKENYQGIPHDLKAFDEICHFTQSQYEYVIGWTRAAKEGDVQTQRSRIVCTGNPPGPGDPGTWVIERWAAWLDPEYSARTGRSAALPGELRWYTRMAGAEVECDSGEPFLHEGEKLFPRSRTFIPARLSDNPYYGDDYLATLQSHPEPLRSQMLYGDFQAGFADDAWQVIPTAWVSAAMRRHQTRERPPVERLMTLGVDVARGGTDQTIIVKNFGHWIDALVKVPGQQTPDGHIVAAMVRDVHRDNAVIYIDSIGIGASPYDLLSQAGLPVVGLNASSASAARDKTGQFGFANLRAELWWRLREMLEPESGYEIVLPNDRELLADLCAPRWKETLRGDIQIESKDDVRKRLQRSTDCGDALVMALYESPVSPPPVSMSTSLSQSDVLRQAGLL